MAWQRCKAVASHRGFDYVEGALTCQNVVAYIFRERIAAGQPVTVADLHGSQLLLTYAMRVAQLSILAHACFKATAGCVNERQNALGQLPDVAELGETSLFLYDPDKPPVHINKPTPKNKLAKATGPEVKKVLEAVDVGQKVVTEDNSQRPCPPETPAPSWTFDPFPHPAPGDKPGGGTGPGFVDVTKPFFPTGFDFGTLGSGTKTGPSGCGFCRS